MTATQVAPVVEPAFQSVGDAFDDILARTGGGAGLAVIANGVPVIDVWGGTDVEGHDWLRETRACGWSTSKAIAALLVEVLVERGDLDVSVPLADYWSGFAREGKQKVTLAHVLTHTAGLPYWPDYGRIVGMGSAEGWDSADDIAEGLASAPLVWQPGEAIGYHAVTFGPLLAEAIARATGRSIASHLEELTSHLGTAMSFGVPRGTPWAPLRQAALPEDPETLAIARRAADPTSIIGKAMLAVGPSSMDFHVTANSASYRRAVLPGSNLFTSAHDLAQTLGHLVLAERGGSELITSANVHEHTRVHSKGPDISLGGIQVRRGLGYGLSSPFEIFGVSPTAYGHAGLGGQLGFVDPAHCLAFAFISDTPIFDGTPDWRLTRLIAETYACLVGGRDRTE